MLLTRRNLSLTLVLGATSLCTGAFSQENGERSVGAGLVFPTPTQALIVNPASIPEGSTLSAEALWRFDIDKPFAAVRAGKAGLGFAGDFRQDPKIGTKDQNVFQAGAGVNL